MFTLTIEINQKCNLRCNYCYLGIKKGNHMEMHTAYACINLAFHNVRIHKDRKLWFDFVGGEPLIDFDKIVRMVEYIEAKNKQFFYALFFSVTTNATVLNTKIMEFLISKRFNVKISLDGCKEVNDRNRISLDGFSVHDKIIENMYLIKHFEKSTNNNIQLTNVITLNNVVDYYSSLHYFTQELNFKIIDTAIDLRVNWTKEDFTELEINIKKSLELYLQAAIRNEGFIWNFADSILNVNKKKSKFYYCGAGIISLYVRTDGSMYACPANLNEDINLGHVYRGYCKRKIDILKRLDQVDNDKCKSCILYETCSAKSCIMSSLAKNNDINIPDPILCKIEKLMFSLYQKNEMVLRKIII